MRFLRLLFLILAMVVGQTQFCRAVYVCRNGGVCKKQLRKSCCDPDGAKASLRSENAKEKCCKLSVCEDHQEKGQSLVPPPFEAGVFILTAPLRIPVAPVAEIRQDRLLWLISHRPQAPPGEASLRAPPVFPA